MSGASAEGSIERKSNADDSRPKNRVTFAYDPGQLFDTIHAVGDGGQGLGYRLASTLLAPRSVGLFEAVGMAYYGVTIDTVTAEGRTTGEPEPVIVLPDVLADEAAPSSAIGVHLIQAGLRVAVVPSELRNLRAVYEHELDRAARIVGDLPHELQMSILRAQVAYRSALEEWARDIVTLPPPPLDTATPTEDD